MINPVRHLSILFSAGLLALLVMGVVIKPMLASFCDLHSLSHVQADHHHDDDRDHEHGQDQDQFDSFEASDKDHARGAHGLLHEGNFGGAYDDTVPVISLQVVMYDQVFVPLPIIAPVPLQHLATPFRPPIA